MKIVPVPRWLKTCLIRPLNRPLLPKQHLIPNSLIRAPTDTVVKNKPKKMTNLLHTALESSTIETFYLIYLLVVNS